MAAIGSKGRHRRGTEPHVVIQPGGSRRFDGRFIREPFFRRAGLNPDNLADEPIAHQFDGAVHRRQRTELAVHTEDPLVLGYLGCEDAALFNTARDRFFQRHILAGPDCRNGHGSVPVIGSGNENGIDSLVRDQVAPVLVNRATFP